MITTVSKVFLFSLLIAISLCVSAEDFTVGETTVPRGEQVSGFITVPEGMDEGSTIPVTIVHGASDGPVLALIAGIHGYPITALQAVRTQVDPAALNRAMRMVVV
jgi:predicted deacylase